MVYIDDRVGSKELHPYLVDRVPCSLSRLAYGDLAWVGNGSGGLPVNIAVERKTISDLCSSITSGRLSGRQLLGLLNTYSHVWVLVEGIWRASPVDGMLEVYKRGGWTPLKRGPNRWMADTIYNYLATLSVLCGVRVWQTNTIQESGQWIVALYRWSRKEWSEHHAHQSFCEIPVRGSRVSLTEPGIVQRVAGQFTGIGFEKAARIAERFKTVRELVSANTTDLCEVEGIGKRLAGSMIEEIGGSKC